MEKTFYSNGKLLITGEYLVLDGTKSLALPTKFGQYLKVTSGDLGQICWTSFDNDDSIWFEETISFNEIINFKDSDNLSQRETLIKILHEAHLINAAFLKSSFGYSISTALTFPKLWGLGTSSTLINNIAQWLQIDSYTLLKNSFGGSGYDIACAQNDTPILFQLENSLPKVEKVIFNPEFTDSIYFVYLNKKQSSKTAIENYYKNKKNLDNDFIFKIAKKSSRLIFELAEEARIDIQNTQVQNSYLLEQNSKLNTQLQNTFNSNSWKITKPLRQASSFLGHLSRRIRSSSNMPAE